MKTTIKVARYLFIISLFAQLSCSSEDGNDGLQGEQGLQGLIGEIGPAGEDGSAILAGNGEPTNDLGEIGDLYLDKDTGALYGPKIDDTNWGSPISLGTPGTNGENGQNGENGTDGSQIFAGDVPPENTFGENGDFYLDKITFNLYGPKANDIWGTPISLAGTNGQDGEDGQDGNANVVYSNYFAPVWNVLDNPRLKRLTINNPDFSLALNNGAILFYLKFNNGDTRLLPYLQFNNGGSMDYSAEVVVKGNNVAEITVRSFGIDLVPSQYGGVGFAFRYVIIPGGVLTGNKSTKPSVNFNDYKAVKKYYGIKD